MELTQATSDPGEVGKKHRPSSPISRPCTWNFLLLSYLLLTQNRAADELILRFITASIVLGTVLS